MKEITKILKTKKLHPDLISCSESGMLPSVMTEHLDASIMFIGIQPSMYNEYEKEQSYNKVVYNSRIGKLFYQPFLKKMDLKYDDIYITNLIFDPHPTNDKPTNEMADCYFQILQKQIDNLPNLKHIVLLGSFVRDYIQEHPLKTDVEILHSKHPSYFMRIGKLEAGINELCTKLKKQENFKEIIQIQSKFNTIYEFYREDGIKKMKEIDFQNYFYVKKIDIDKVISLLNNESRDQDFEIRVGFKSIYGDELHKIVMNKYEFWKFRKILKFNNVDTYEAWLDVGLKYLLKNLKVFSKNRKVGIIDIENDMSLDCVHTPKTITSICIYNYTQDRFIIWVLENPNRDKISKRNKDNEELRIFESEKEMMLDFCDIFKKLDFDICGGWNSNNFDWPYIINRLKVLNINPNRLSNFGEVETRGYRDRTGKWNFTNTILGVELIDFILVLKKNTCYSAQPSSFSLESTANFYLDTKKLTNIGAEAWKTNIDDFIKYNIKDVELVKQIIDKFKLIDFLMVIQTEITPIPLNNVTHNSVILLHYLKHHFPNVIIPDNHGKYNMREDGVDNIIDLTNSHIRIKAAHVIPAHPGIHDNVSIFDFSGLYPSIIRTFNICPSTINDSIGNKIDDIVIWHMSGSANEDLKSDNKGRILKEWFCEKYFKTDTQGIYPKILEDLTTRRNFHKHQLPELEEKYGKDSSEYLLALYRSDVLKQINNSVTGDTIIIIRDNNNNINHKCIKDIDLKIDKFALSVNRNTLKHEWKQILNKIVHVPKYDYVYEIRTVGNFHLRITPDHTLFKIKNNKLAEVSGRDLKKDDEICLINPNIHNKRDLEYIDTLKYLKNDNINLLLPNEFTNKCNTLKNYEKICNLFKNKNLIKFITRSTHGAYFDSKWGRFLIDNSYFNFSFKSVNGYKCRFLNITEKGCELRKIAVFMEKNLHRNVKSLNWIYKIRGQKNILTSFKELGFIPKYHKYYFTCNKSTQYVRPKIKITDSFLQTLGFIVSEGCIGKLDVKVTQNLTNFKMFEICHIFALENNISNNFKKLKNCKAKCASYHFYSKIWAKIFKTMCGGKSHYKQLPDFVFDLSKRQQEILMKALVDGDGMFLKDGAYCYGSSSRKLIQQILSLNNSIRGDYNSNYDHWRPVLGGTKNKFKSTASSILDKTIVKTHKLKIKHITKIKLKKHEKVYDISVKDNENFVGGFIGNFVIHNSLYGVNAFNRFPLFNPYIAAAITSISRKCIKKVADWLKNDYKYEVITGDSVTGSAKILIENESEISIENIWKNNANAIIKNKNKETKECNFKVFTTNIKHKNVFSNCIKIIRHKVNKKIYRIELIDGNYTDVTEDHSLIVLKNGIFVECKPCNLKYVLVGKGYEIVKTKVINIKEIEYDGYVYDLCVPKTQKFFSNNILHHNTDSLMIKHPKEVDPKKLATELNDKLKKWILSSFNINPDFYCMELEYEKTYKTFVMKDAKKKYYGFLIDGSFQAKGFSIIQHVLSKSVKEMIKKIYIMLLEKVDTKIIRKEIAGIKKEFYKLSYEDISKDLKIAKNLDEYNNNIQHIRGAKYSNKYLGTSFNSGSTGKLLFIKETTDSVNYPMTDVVLLGEDTKLPDALKIDYDILWEKLFITNIQQLESIPEMNITRLINPNTELGDFF